MNPQLADPKSAKSYFSEDGLTESIYELSQGSFLKKDISEIRGSGWVVASLEASLWVFYHSNSFKEAVLMAANLGDDADTTAAIVGQIAGSYYGVQGIPGSWLKIVSFRNDINTIAKTLFQQSFNQTIIRIHG